MEILNTYEIHSKPDGVTSVASAPTVLIAAAIIKNNIACINIDNETNPLTPVAPTCEDIINLNPMLSIVKTTREVSNQADYISLNNSILSVFNKQVRQSVEELYTALTERYGDLSSEFGNVVNIPILDGLDLSSYPIMVSRYRMNYISIFETYTPFIPAQMDFMATKGDWKIDKLDTIFSLVQESDTSPVKVMERWYDHATSTLAIPKLKEYLNA